MGSNQQRIQKRYRQSALVAFICIVIVLILYYLFEQGQMGAIDPDITISVLFSLGAVSVFATLTTIFLKINSMKK